MTERTQVAPVAGARTNETLSVAPSHADDLAAARAELAQVRADLAGAIDTMAWQRREIGKLRAALAMMVRS